MSRGMSTSKSCREGAFMHQLERTSDMYIFCVQNINPTTNTKITQTQRDGQQIAVASPQVCKEYSLVLTWQMRLE